MSYQGISIKEAMERINAANNGWFLPSVQRPYVWGSRYENELYICKLFDSLLRGYPIGGLILWNTSIKIPYREFMGDFTERSDSRIVEQGLWTKPDKWLVYDGQQRLRTLFSCLKYTFNNNVLVFDLLFDLSQTDGDPNQTGFSFSKKGFTEPRGIIRMNELFSKLPEEKIKYRKEIFSRSDNFSEKEESLIETNIDTLWKVFVERDKKSLAFFLISHNDESMVNEIFQRLNTGGVTLSQADLLFSMIKGTDTANYDFEERLQDFSQKIYNSTGNGYLFDAYDILQLIHLLSRNTVRVDPKKIKSKKDLSDFNEFWKNLENPLLDFFTDFIWGEFKINSNKIIPKKLAILPMVVFFYLVYQKGDNFKKLSQDTVQKLKQYLILSQINDWNLQGIVDRFTSIISESFRESSDFPSEKIIKWLNETKKRNTELHESNFIDYRWFSLKVLMPARIYQFGADSKRKFSPQIDHIFPLKLDGEGEEYADKVDVIWNMQPIKGDINNFKRKRHPKEFFSSPEGKKYIAGYDFLPSADPNDRIWNNHLEFINERKQKMKEFLNRQYGLNLK